ncbi:MAG TPA: phosphoribosyltransferase [Gemmatimonadaceae bacterium]|nr:phosphoribosyltransferase [Gemmatimonadaceae bacterium]
MTPPFHDRADAGRKLAAVLHEYAGRPDVRVLALPRGGVPVGYEVARALGAPLDIFLVRKLGLPGHEEFAMGAIASDGVVVLDDDVIRKLRVDRRSLDSVIARERRELERRAIAYRGVRPPTDIRGCIVIVVDDGLATGSTMRAAVLALRREEPQRIVIAVPVAAPATCRSFRQGEDAADEVVCLVTPEPFQAVGLWYTVFDQTSDDEVRSLLAAALSNERSNIASI